MGLTGKNVLVTGGAGFIGSALVRELAIEKANVTVFDNFSSGSMSNLMEIRDDIVDVVKGDVLAPNFRDFLIKNDIEYVFHLAAEPYIPRFYNDPSKFFEVNANGTMNVLLSCKGAGVERILYYSTSEVYGNAKYVPMDESHPTLPHSTYGVSKLAADRLCFTLFREQGIPVVILRQFNIFGPRETQPYIIPELITQLSQTNKVKLGNIKARRDLTFVGDAVRAAKSLMECKDAVGKIVNVGSGKDWSVEELTRQIAELMGWKDVQIEIEKERLRCFDIERLQCDYSKMRKLTGWEPRLTLKEGLEKTIEWYQDNGNRWVWETKIAPEEKLWKLSR